MHLQYNWYLGGLAVGSLSASPSSALYNFYYLHPMGVLRRRGGEVPGLPRICKLFKLVLFLCNFLRGTFVPRCSAPHATLHVPLATFRCQRRRRRRQCCIVSYACCSASVSHSDNAIVAVVSAAVAVSIVASVSAFCILACEWVCSSVRVSVCVCASSSYNLRTICSL